MKKIVILTGAGISAESGIKTFRDSDGMWESYKIEDVATPNAWHKDPALVLDFYNIRRRDALNKVPNSAHIAIAALESKYIVQVITQNVDNLHEKAGSTNVLHLHGELFKSRSTMTNTVYDMQGTELNLGDLCENGGQLRPHIVWFGENVPMLYKAIEIVEEADIFIVIGTSLQVYPAASLIDFVNEDVPKWIIDPHIPITKPIKNLHKIPEKATVGMEILKELL